MIDHLIDAPLSKVNSVLWVDALAFEGNWDEIFDAEKTHPASFKNLSGESKIINMMFRENGTKEYGEISDFRFATLHYGNKAFAFTAIMPNEGVDFNLFLKNMNASTWHEIVDSEPNRHTVSISLPKFEQQSGIDLNRLMTDDPEINFDSHYFVNQFENGEDLALTMMQVVDVKIDESGAQAAAVTVVAGEVAAPDFDLIAFNRPFIYLIHEKSTGAILIMGAVTGF